MIQRVQTLYLLAAAALMTLACFLPLGTFYGTGDEQLVFRVFNLTAAPSINLGLNSVLFAVLLVGTAALLLVTIFLYKRRWLQLRLCFSATVLLLGSQGFIAFYIYHFHSMTWKFGMAAVFPLVAFVLTILAIRSIVHDDRLVKSLDRLR